MFSKITLATVALAGMTATEAAQFESVHPKESRFKGWSQSQLKEIMGLSQTGLVGTHQIPEVHAKFQATEEQLKDIPRDFDSRNTFGACIGAIRDQAHCGSCWAFGGSETLSDNLCIQGVHTGPLSAQDLVSCDTADHGCQGGDLIDLWARLSSTGIVDQSCMPYTAFNGTVNACPGSCSEAGGSGDFTRYKCGEKYNMLEDEMAIKNAVMQMGSAETGFYVYNDFTTYSSGIYKHDNTTSNFPLGGHAVKIIGWGQSIDVKYWRVANSWGSSWGESGFFRIDMSDTYSAFALGGAMNCGKLAPAPTPTPPAPTCKNILPDDECPTLPSAKGAKDCEVRHLTCAKACHCCDYFNPPAYCTQE